MIAKRWTLCLLLLAGADPAAAADRFDARFSDDLRTVSAELCFDGAAPSRIYRHSRARPHASALQFGGQPLRARERDTRIELPALPDDACLSWTFDLGGAADRGDYRTAFRVGDSTLAVTTLWFWKGPWQRPVEARVSVPGGVSFSTPWPRHPDEPDRYLPLATPSGWNSRSAIGRFEQKTLAVSGGEVQLALLGDLSRDRADKLTRWIRTSLDAVTPVFGHFPRPHTQVVVVPIGPRGEPVPWAHVVRGGGPSVQLYVDETRPLAEFDADWTATHEFSHLLLPYVSREDRWLSEGLASYYQNVLRARDGRLSDREAWQKLFEGFERGRQATRRETLEEAVEQGRGRTMRVYWSGAAMMLQADTALRQATDGAWTLDSALAALMDCCFQAGKRWSAREVMGTLDRLTGTRVFMTVLEENVELRAFPAVDDTFDALGLDTNRGRVRLVDGAPLGAIRQAIMAAPGENRSAGGAENAP